MRKLFLIAAVACGGSQSGRVPVDPPVRAAADPPAKASEVTMPPVHPWPTTRVGNDSDTLHGQSPHRDDWVARLKQVFYFDAISAPVHRKGRYFYTRKHADKEKTIVYWKHGEAGAEKVLFD